MNTTEPPQPLLVLGARGHARSVFAIALAMNQAQPEHAPWQLLGFIEDGVPDLDPIHRLGAQVVGTSKELSQFAGAQYILGVGAADTKRLLAARAEDAGLTPATLVHPTAVIDPDVVLGPGCIIGRFAAVTVNARVGRHSTIATQVSLAHDCRIGEYAFISQGVILAGTVRVGDDAFLGVGCLCRQGVTIGAGATVGMGTAVIRDVAPGTTVVGVPAREIG